MSQPGLIISTTPESLVDQSVPRLEVAEYEKLLQDYGYEVFMENNVKCPCSSRNMNVPLPTCISCRGLGWVFINKKDVRLVLQSMGRNSKYESWTEQNTGTVSITAPYAYRLSVGDRITLKKSEDIFTENLNVRDFIDLKKSCFTIYDILNVLGLYRFISEEEPLIELTEGVDYIKIDNQITLVESKFENFSSNELFLSIRYTYNPQYIVVDIPRNIMASDKINCDLDTSIANFPVRCIGRIVHQTYNQR